MKKTKILTVLLAVICVLAFSACGASFDPATYTEGTLEANFHGNVSKDYVDMLSGNATTEDLEAEYDNFIDTCVSGIITSMGISAPDDTLTQNTAEMYRNIYSNTKFEVAEEYTEGENGEYYVDVTVYPLLTVNDVLSDKDGSISAALEDAYTPEKSYEDIIILSLEMIIEAMNKALEEPVYGDPITINVRIETDDNGNYTISEEQLLELDLLLLGN